MAITLDKLINDERFCGESVIIFLLYLPIGLILVVSRIIILSLLWILTSILPKKSSMNRLMSTIACFSFGIYIKQQGSRDKKSRLIISNYVSVMDPLALSYSTGSISPKKWTMSQFFSYILGVRNVGPQTNKQYFAEHPNIPIAVQPEDIPTNGRGVLKFKQWPFQLCNRVQPVAINVSRDLTRVTVHSWYDRPEKFPWSDAFWFLWSPCTTYSLTFLPPVERQNSETDEEFALNVQRAIADNLQVEASSHDEEDLCSGARRLLSSGGGVAVPRGAPSPASGGPGPGSELQRMAAQVKEVFPTIPLAVILQDLGRTRSIDVTLTNILEGSVTYVPEEPQAQPGPSSQPSQTRVAPGPVLQAFPKNARERQLSYQEKKSQLIAHARQKYIEKHGLNLALNNC